MALTKSTFRARTRGKSPKTFTYEGYGKPVERKVAGKENNPLVVDAEGNPVDYKVEKKDGKYSGGVDGKVNVKEDGTVEPQSGYSFVFVDDADIEAIAPKADASEDEQKAFLKDVMSAFGGNYRSVGIAALVGLNSSLRDEVAPKSEQTKEDELAEIVSLLRAEGHLKTDEDETKWRRAITMAFDVQDVHDNKLDFAYSTKKGKLVADKRPKAVAA